jgi:hypothetical protein
MEHVFLFFLLKISTVQQVQVHSYVCERRNVRPGLRRIVSPAAAAAAGRNETKQI